MAHSKEARKTDWQPTTISQVAERAGVSKATVSIVLNARPSPIKISETTRQIVMKAAKELNYSPNRLARAFSTSRSHVLGVIASSVHDLFSSDYSARLMKGITHAANHSHYNIMIFDDEIMSNPDSTQSYVSLITSRNVDGIILISPDRLNPAMAQRARELKEKGMPFVCVWRSPHSVKGTTIKVNNELGVRQATQYLLSLGHRRIAVITHGIRSQSSQERLQAFQKVLADHHVPFCPEMVWHNEFHPADDHRIAEEILALPNRPTAIFSFYDPVAVNVINILTNKGVRIPEEISVMGFGDVYTEVFARPELTTVKESLVEIGQKAVSFLVDYLQKENSVLPEVEITIDPSLMIRASCGPAPPNSGWRDR